MPSDNGRAIRNLMQGANFLQSDLVRFCRLSLLDFVRGPDAPPFVPRHDGACRMPDKAEAKLADHYLNSPHDRTKTHEMAAIFAGKIPHIALGVPGGVTVLPAADKVTAVLWRLNQGRDSVDNVYVQDVLPVARAYREYAEMGPGPRHLLSSGVFDLDKEQDAATRKRLFRMGRVKEGKLVPMDPVQITGKIRYGW